MRKLAAAVLVMTLLINSAHALVGDIDTVRSQLVALYSGAAAQQTGKARAAAIADLNQRINVLMKDPAAWPDMDAAQPEVRGVAVAKHYVHILEMTEAWRGGRSS